MGTVRALLVAGAAATAAGCTARPMYEWVSYQDSLYVLWVRPESFDPAERLGRLTEQIAATESEGRAVPPGVRAHLGWLLATSGDTEGAARMFAAEKAAFPESAVFVDGLLSRMGR